MILYEYVTNTPPHGYRFIYIDEVKANPTFKSQVQNVLARYSMAAVINGSIQGSRLGGAIAEDCGRSANRVTSMVLVKRCYPF